MTGRLNMLRQIIRPVTFISQLNKLTKLIQSIMRNNAEPVSVNTPTNARVAPEYGRMVYRTGALYFVHDDQKKKPGKN
jgi:hypothetical protein